MTRKEEIDEKSSNELGSIDYQVGFSCGAKWADKTLINKACEWLMDNVNNYIINDKTLGKDWLKVKSEMFDDFKKAMEE